MFTRRTLLLPLTVVRTTVRYRSGRGGGGAGAASMLFHDLFAGLLLADERQIRGLLQ